MTLSRQFTKRMDGSVVDQTTDKFLRDRYGMHISGLLD